jgi:3'-phosphoadenosine 5'-phosphosulfate sulfotransferase (PAPS reductase)/FAD synthetase
MIDKTMATRIATQLGWAPPREWVGLTFEEVMEITGVKPTDSDWNVTIAHKWIREIEAKLKEKNSTSVGKTDISNTIPVKSSQLEGYIMNQEYTAGEADAWINGHRVGQKKGDQLRLAVKEFFEKYLDVVEESDSGRAFKPIEVSCCRAMKIEPLNKLLAEMRALSGAELKDDNV